MSCCFIDFLPRDSTFASGVSEISSPSDQSPEFRQRHEINPRPANSHFGAYDGIQHPASHRDNNAGRAFHLEKLPRHALLHPPHAHLQAEKGMPTITNFPLFPDMGRMNG